MEPNGFYWIVDGSSKSTLITMYEYNIMIMLEPNPIKGFTNVRVYCDRLDVIGRPWYGDLEQIFCPKQKHQPIISKQ